MVRVRALEIIHTEPTWLDRDKTKDVRNSSEQRPCLTKAMKKEKSLC